MKSNYSYSVISISRATGNTYVEGSGLTREKAEELKDTLQYIRPDYRYSIVKDKQESKENE